MLATSATRPAMLSETMRRVRLEKLRVKKNWPTRRSQSSSHCPPDSGGLSLAKVSRTTGDEASSAFRLASGCVRSSKGQTAVCSKKVQRCAVRILPQRMQHRQWVSRADQV